MTIRVNFRNDAARNGWWFTVPYNAKFIDELKYSVDSKRRSYNPKTHEWFVQYGVAHVAAWLIRRHFGEVNVTFDGQTEYHDPRRTWSEERQYGEWHQEYRQQAHQQESSYNSSLTDALNVLGLPMNAHWKDVERAYKCLAKQHHPDRGGNTRKMQDINTAYDKIRKEMGK